jgi:hypothetical protein
MPAPIQLQGPYTRSRARRWRIALAVVAALLCVAPFTASAIAAYLRA